MLYYSANISQLFAKKPIAERFKLISEAGFAYYELLFPQRENLSELLELHQRYNVSCSLFDLDTDEAGPRGHLTIADDRPFFNRLEESLVLAPKLGSTRLNALVGLAQEGIAEGVTMSRIISRLKKGGEMCASAGVMLLIEALNKPANPGYFVTTSKMGVDLVQEVNNPAVLFQYDYFHMQIMEGNLIETVRKNLKWIGHVQIADLPGRHEPGTGEINYANVLGDLDKLGYGGFVGLEYVESDAPDPFAWLSREDRGRRLPA